MSPRPHKNTFVANIRPYAPPRLCLAGARAALTDWDLIFSRQQATSPPPSPKMVAPLSPVSQSGEDENMWSSSGSTFVPHDIAFVKYTQKRRMEQDEDVSMPLTPQSSASIDEVPGKPADEMSDDGVDPAATIAQAWIDEMDMAVEDGWSALAAENEASETKEAEEKPSESSAADSRLPLVDSVIQSLSAISLRSNRTRIVLPPPPRASSSMALPCRPQPAHMHYNHHHHLHAEIVMRPRTPLFGKPGNRPSPGNSASTPVGNGVLKPFAYRRYGRLSCSPPRIAKTLRGSGRQTNPKTPTPRMRC